MRPPVNLRLALVAVATILIACTGSTSSGVTVADAWARPAIAGGETAAYFVVTNPGLHGFADANLASRVPHRQSERMQIVKGRRGAARSAATMRRAGCSRQDYSPPPLPPCSRLPA